MPSPSHAISVRRLHTQDFDQWQVLWSGYLAFYRADVPSDVTSLTFKRLCGGEQGMLGLAAVAPDDTLIGLAHLVFHPATWSASGYCYLEDLYVDPSHRGGHTARTLFEAVYTQARERNTPRVYWHTQQFNGPARSLYETVGQLTSFVVYEHLVD
ncbi:MAG: GNAT family N-acetyltransferase [Solirubrobacteraceae bacterium]